MREVITFIVRLPGKPEHRATLETELLKVLDTMADEPDFINTYLHRSADDPDTLLVYETWGCSWEYFRTHHLGKPYRQEYEAVLPALLKQERTIELLTAPIRTYLK